MSGGITGGTAMLRATLVAAALSCMSVEAADAGFDNGNELFQHCQSWMKDKPDFGRRSDVLAIRLVSRGVFLSGTQHRSETKT
jgi:hypothetical protein